MAGVYARQKNGLPVETYTANEIDLKIQEAASGSGSDLDFDLLSNQKGNATNTVFGTNTVTDTITNSGQLVAERIVTFQSGGVQEVIKYYESGVVKLTTTSVTSFNTNSVKKEVS